MTLLVIWLLPLVVTFAIGSGAYVVLCWAISLILMLVRKWRGMLLLMGLALAGLHMIHPAPDVKFFIGMLILILPLSWQSQKKDSLSPSGLAPTIFLVGSVFIFHVQFYLLILLITWFLLFLLWYSMMYAGWSMRDIRIRWSRFFGVAFGISVAIVLIFALIPKISPGVIPSFAQERGQVMLTDQLKADGLKDLLADDTIAFRAFPQDEVASLTPYWRVFILDEQNKDGWSRSERTIGNEDQILSLDAPPRRFDILAEEHNPAYLPVPGWPANSEEPGYQITSFGEIENKKSAQRHATVMAYDVLSKVTQDPRPWGSSTQLNDVGRLAEWAREKRRQMSTDRQFADFLLSTFRRQFTYSLNSTYIADTSTEALDTFFFDGRSGHCSFYAQAMATALRAGGVPANVVTGYLGGEWNSYGQYWIIRNNMAHAWVEARLDGGDWQRMDPTLIVSLPPDGEIFSREGGELVHTAQASGRRQSQMPQWLKAVQWLDSLNTRVTLSILRLEGSSGQNIFKRLAGLDFKALVWMVAGLMTSISFVVVMIITGRVLRTRWLRPSSVEEGQKLEWQLERLLLQTGSARKAGEGLLDYAERSSTGWPEMLKTQTLNLARQIYSVRFNPASPGQGHLRRLAADIRRHRKALKSCPGKQKTDETRSTKISLPYFLR